jgi:hypothetical protein
MKSTGSGGGWEVWVVSVVALASGCLPPQRGAPRADGVEPRPVTRIQAPAAVTPVSTPQQLQTLLSELNSSELQPGAAYLTPEQIAAMAVAELEQANPWDAALLLNIATYRYGQHRRPGVRQQA